MLLLQLEAISNCDNFTMITILYNNDILTWDYIYWHVGRVRVHVKSHWIMAARKHLFGSWGGEGLV